MRSKTAISVGRFLADSGATGGLISLQQAERHKLSWQPLRVKVATADGGAAVPVGLLEGVKLIMLPGTPLATAVPFDALVMDTGGKGAHDAILGREQDAPAGHGAGLWTSALLHTPQAAAGLLGPGRGAMDLCQGLTHCG